MEPVKELTGYPSIDKPWLQHYSKEAINTPLPESTLYKWILHCNADNMSRIALNYYGRNITYKQLFATVNRIASALESMGVKKQSVVTVCMINSPETIMLMFALNKIGAVANMVYGADTPAEIMRHIKNAASDYVFVLDIFQEKILKIIDQTTIQRVIVATLTQGMSLLSKIGAGLTKKMRPIALPNDSRFINWKQFLRYGSDASDTADDPNAPALITYTGGTTGGSKGVILSSKAIIAVAQQYILGEKELSRDDTWVQVIPLFVAYGVSASLMVPLCVGMTLIVRITMTDSISRLCKKFKPNHIIYGPAFWETFADDNKDLNLSYLIAPICGGDTLPEKAEKKINAYLETHGSRYRLMNGYGMTEVGSAVSVNYKDKYEFGSVGLPFVHNVVSAFDTETGKELKYGEQGEICIQTPSVMIGYINNEEETANIIRTHTDGSVWVHTGDLGYINNDGFIHISGRLKRYMLCIANGVQKKVFSLDIEKAIAQHPAVNKCVVVPVPNRQLNQVPVAFVSLTDEAADQMNAEQLLIQYAEDHLEPVYRPKRYYFVSNFPLTKIGKIDYRALEREAESKEA